VRKRPRARQAKSKAREAAYHELAAQEGPYLVEEIALKIPTGDTRLGHKIVELEGVGKTYHGKGLFSDLTLGLVPGEELAAGINSPESSGYPTISSTREYLEGANFDSMSVILTIKGSNGSGERARCAWNESLPIEVD
jgi:hypothetical protein